MNQHAKINAPVSVTTGPIRGSHKVYAQPKEHPNLRVPFREIALSDPNEAPMRVYDPSGPYTQSDFIPDLTAGLPAVREPWIAARGYAAIPGRAIKPEDNGNVSADRLAPHCPATRTLRAAADGQLVTQYEFAQRGDHHGRDDLCRASREPRARGGGGGRGGKRGGRRQLRRGNSRVHDAGVRAQRDRARPGDHSRQHQPCRTGADGDRPQFPGQGQRQYRQFGRVLRRRGGGREDGVGDPLGRRHRDGPLDRAQHPQHPLLDPAQFAGADRHGADLSSFGEGRRRPAQARLGGVQGHADRAGGAGGGLLHHPRRRSPAPCAADRQARDRHRVARRVDHGALVSRGASRVVPLRAFRRHLRHHAQVRRVVLARRRAAAGLERRRQRRRAIRGAGDAWAS